MAFSGTGSFVRTAAVFLVSTRTSCDFFHINVHILHRPLETRARGQGHAPRQTACDEYGWSWMSLTVAGERAPKEKYDRQRKTQSLKNSAKNSGTSKQPMRTPCLFPTKLITHRLALPIVSLPENYVSRTAMTPHDRRKSEEAVAQHDRLPLPNAKLLPRGFSSPAHVATSPFGGRSELDVHALVEYTVVNLLSHFKSTRSWGIPTGPPFQTWRQTETQDWPEEPCFH